MSEIKVDNLTGKTSAGDITVTSEGGAATMQLQQGLIKVWANTTADGTTLQGSFNVSSLGDIATGKQAFNFTNAMTNSSFSGSATNGDSSNPDGLFFANVSSSRVDGESLQFDNSVFGDNPQRVVVVGDLA